MFIICISCTDYALWPFIFTYGLGFSEQTGAVHGGQEMKAYTSKANEDTTIVSLSGSFDAVGSDSIELELREIARSGTNVAIDLSDVTFITSQGVRMLVLTAKLANAENKRLVLIGPKPPIYKVLAVMGVNKLLDIYETAEAMSSIRLT